MTKRPKMDEELAAINKQVREMTDHIRKDILNAVDAVVHQDAAMAQKIIDQGDEVDDMEKAINSACFHFMATQAPVASDLRYCISVRKMARHLERMGDHCEDIARYAIRMKEADITQELRDIPYIASMASRMAENAIDSFLNQDQELAKKVWKADEEVDEVYRKVFEEEMQMAAQGYNPEICGNLAFIAEHLERIADYATNICEETMFVLEGEEFDI